MPVESTLLKEAIADAKAVRQTALANAKVALEEQFKEKYTQMFAKKLAEEAAPAAEEEEGMNAGQPAEAEIDELIKELEAELPQEPHAEPDGDEVAPAAPAPMAPPLGAGAPPLGAPAACPPGMPCPPAVGAPVPPVAPAPIDGAVPPPVDGAAGMPPVAPAPMAPPMDAGAIPPAAPTAPPPSEAPEVGAEEEDEDVDLNELLQSLQEEVEEDEEEEEGKKLDETKLASSGIGGNKAGGSDNKKPSAAAHNSSGIESGGIKQEGMPSPDGTKVGPEDATKATRPNKAKNATSTNLTTPSMGGSSGPALKATRPNCKGDIENTSKLHEENETLKKQLAESYETIKYVKGQLNEINLLNAKLLYTNKLFKEFNMNNEQKMRVVEMFDLSKNVREVKLTYANIAESLNISGVNKKVVKSNTNVQAITEGLASGAVASTKPSAGIITEAKQNDIVSKFQKLAGISKK